MYTIPTIIIDDFKSLYYRLCIIITNYTCNIGPFNLYSNRIIKKNTNHNQITKIAKGLIPVCFCFVVLITVIRVVEVKNKVGVHVEGSVSALPIGFLRAASEILGFFTWPDEQ